MAKGKKTGGRTKGTPNKKTQLVKDMLDEMGCNPIALLAETALGRPIVTKAPGADPDEPPTEFYPTTDQIISARSKLSEFYAPKLKAVEHSGNIATHEQTLAALAGEAESDD